MELRGYLQEVVLTDEALTVTGTNKMARVALRGEQHENGPLVIDRDQIAGVEHKAANPIANGRITVTTNAGEKAVLHFRRKDNDAFANLARELGT